MNTLLFLGKCCLSAGLACLVAIMSSIMIAIILAKIVDILGLNYNGDTYWTLNVVGISLIVSWIISFGYFMSTIK